MQPVCLTTARLKLRCPQITDIDDLTTALGDRTVSQWLARVPHPYNRHDAVRWVSIAADNWRRDVAYPFNCFLDGCLVGGIGITRISDTDGVLGYWLAAKNWGQGLGREMLAAATGFGFDALGLTVLTAATHPENDRSAGLLLKCGFQAIGDQVYLHPPPDNRLKGPHYQLSVAQYRASQAP
jgi:[ribosomal protein S5]-alanine N-acetyltransferase